MAVEPEMTDFDANLEKSLLDYRSAPFPVDGVTLYSSRLNPKGAIHTPVREFALA